MKPTQYNASKIELIHTFLRGHRPHGGLGWLFRGQADKNWPLVPKAGRKPFLLRDKKDLSNRHLGRFREWCSKAIAYIPNLPENEWERLALAQHYGLATCLLDWTTNPLVGLFFACAESPQSDAVLYAYSPHRFIEIHRAVVDQTEFPEIHGVGFLSRSFTTRILNQRGCFTVHSPVDQPIVVEPCEFLPNSPNLAQMVIPASLKTQVMNMLDDYGINRVTLFPDLDGLSAHINWETAQMNEPLPPV